ncbi:MAG: hypothetical protein KAI53_03125 [Candidatus Aenigmarchaeota archaeon]|nr:hypothetical protein [Candidatus Aenigmarchaeota archaeon]
MGCCGVVGIPITTNDILDKMITNMGKSLNANDLNRYKELRTQYKKKYQKSKDFLPTSYCEQLKVHDAVLELITSKIIDPIDSWKVLERERHNNKEYKSIKRIRAEHYLDEKYQQVKSLIGISS